MTLHRNSGVNFVSNFMLLRLSVQFLWICWLSCFLNGRFTLPGIITTLFGMLKLTSFTVLPLAETHGEKNDRGFFRCCKSSFFVHAVIFNLLGFYFCMINTLYNVHCMCYKFIGQRKMKINAPMFNNDN